MEQRLKDVIEECARASHEGTRQFGAVLGTLIENGVEAYHADYRARKTTYYLPNGDTHTVALHTPQTPIPLQFSAAQLQEAIRGSQRGEVRYPEFLQRSMAAGCMGYIVFIAGRHVVYFGRDGSQHLERFPS